MDETTNDTTNQEVVPLPSNQLRTIRGIRPVNASDRQSLQDAQTLGELSIGRGAAAAAGADMRGPVAGPGQFFFGKGLVDEENYLVRGQYSIDQDNIEQEMVTFNSSELAIWAAQAKRTGFYVNSEPSPLILSGRGYTSTDINAFGNFMRYGNQTGYVTRALLRQMSNWSQVSGGGGTTVKVTAPEDIKYYMEQAWLSRFGRKPNKTDIDSAIDAIQSRERQAAAQGQSAPSTAVAVAERAKSSNKSEGAAYQLGNAVKLAFQFLGGG